MKEDEKRNSENKAKQEKKENRKAQFFPEGIIPEKDKRKAQFFSESGDNNKVGQQWQKGERKNEKNDSPQFLAERESNKNVGQQWQKGERKNEKNDSPQFLAERESNKNVEQQWQKGERKNEKSDRPQFLAERLENEQEKLNTLKPQPQNFKKTSIKEILAEFEKRDAIEKDNESRKNEMPWQNAEIPSTVRGDKNLQSLADGGNNKNVEQQWQKGERKNERSENPQFLAERENNKNVEQQWQKGERKNEKSDSPQFLAERENNKKSSNSLSKLQNDEILEKIEKLQRPISEKVLNKMIDNITSFTNKLNLPRDNPNLENLKEGISAANSGFKEASIEEKKFKVEGLLKKVESFAKNDLEGTQDFRDNLIKITKACELKIQYPNDTNINNAYKADIVRLKTLKSDYIKPAIEIDQPNQTDLSSKTEASKSKSISLKKLKGALETIATKAKHNFEKRIMNKKSQKAKFSDVGDKKANKGKQHNSVVTRHRI